MALPSSPVIPGDGAAPRASAAPPADVLSAAASSQSGKLLTISCAANGRFLVPQSGSDWMSCAGEPERTPLHEGLFTQEQLGEAGQLAFRHVVSRKYLSIVPPDDASASGMAWVVRAHSPTIGPQEAFVVRSGRGGHTFLYNVHARAHINHRFGDVVRGHDAAGKPAEPVTIIECGQMA